VFGLMARSSAAPPAPDILQCARSNALTMLSRSIRFKSSPRMIFVLEELTGSLSLLIGSRLGQMVVALHFPARY
jgi:hypothetical protein